MLDNTLLLVEGYPQEAIDASNAGLAELISQQSEEDAIERVAAHVRLAHRYASVEKQRREYIYWIQFLSALGRFHFYPSISRLRVLLEELDHAA